MRRLRTAKAIASRIDLVYFKRPHVLRRSRLILTAVCLVGALAWWGVYAGRGNSLYNPGAVTSPHAQIENNCAACHDADGKGGFFRTVSDNACLRCHDGAIHADKQLTFVSTSVKMADAPGASSVVGAVHSRSSNCVACHTEHRGHDALLGTSNAHCTQCHADLKKNVDTTKGPMVVAGNVSEFTTAEHPWFGRELTADRKTPGNAGNGKAPTLVDPTVLDFKHAKHMGLEEINHNCAKCHTTDAPGAPVTAAEGESTASAAGASGLSLASQSAYMRPVSYAKACSECHDLRINLPKAPRVPHEKIELVRGWFMSLQPEELEWLAPKPKVEEKSTPGRAPPRRPPARSARPGEDGAWREVLLASPPPPRGGKPAAPPPKAGSSDTGDTAAPPERPKTASDVAMETIEKVVKRLGGIEGLPDRKDQVKAKFDELKAQFAARAAAAPATTQPAGPAAWVVDPAITRFYASYLVEQQCALCHTMKELPAAGGGASAVTPALLTTTPTGIGTTPRKWFAHSRFDHKPHRNITCVDCHAKAETSEATSDVLSPNMTWTTAAGEARSCVQCHHAPTSADRGAGADCQACHVYHDRSREGPPHTVTTIAEIVGWTKTAPGGKKATPGAPTAAPATQPAAAGGGEAAAAAP